MSPPASDVSGPRHVVAALLAAFWIGLVAVLGYLAIWGVLGLLRATGIPVAGWVWPALAAVQGLLLALPLALLAHRTRPRRYRAIFNAWGWGALAFVALAPIRFIPVLGSTLTSLTQIVLLLVLWLLIRAAGVRHAREQGRRGGAVALALAPLLLAPWLLWTAPGSPLDILLNVVVGLLGGAFAAEVITEILLPALHRTSSPGWTLTLGGFAASVFLAMLAVALGAAGIGLLLWLLLPAAGWLAVALARVGSEPFANRRPVALLLGIAMASPMVMVDTEETLLLLNAGARDILTWASLAALASAGIALLLGLLAWLARNYLPQLRGGWGWSLAALGTWALAGGLWFFAGQPGLYGDRLFVILETQADLAELEPLDTTEARRSAAYERLVRHADETQAPLRATLDRWRVPYQPYYLVNAIEVQGGALHRLWLSSRPEVDRVVPSPVLRPLPEAPDRARGTASAPEEVPWNLSMIGADRAWAEFGARGQGIVLGQADSGVELTHPELSDAYRGRDDGDDYHWLDPWYDTSSPTDWGGHGTHTAATVLGNRVGVAPDAEWIGCVNLTRNYGNPAHYLDCMQFMLAPYPQAGDPLRDGDPTRAADVLNNSWGCPSEEGCDPTTLTSAIEALRASGIFVVASAGNEGVGACSTISAPPALDDAAFTVGAVDRAGALAVFSSRGPVTADGSGRVKPDIVAPGVDILSAFPNGSYQIASGTSMAGPHVAGVVALMWSANPALIGEIERTERLIIAHALPFDSGAGGCGDPRNLVGHGLIDAYAAVRAAVQEGE